MTSSPSMKICPLVGFSKPATKRKTVVLPQPEGPSNVTKLPFLISRSKLPITVLLPKRLQMFLSTTKFCFSTVMSPKNLDWWLWNEKRELHRPVNRTTK
ncbi:Uncharacterised protein [Vibrio cholerae]|nr:Uncharacterised protein [Vibrio cholerae]CSC62631.1 Uncharacterised protein [Vibrio cholerae]CSC86936.1 Uncharacterised protein [Vibrio cholerae]